MAGDIRPEDRAAVRQRVSAAADDLDKFGKALDAAADTFRCRPPPTMPDPVGIAELPPLPGGDPRLLSRRWPTRSGSCAGSAGRRRDVEP
jgi:hypothetical protein